MPVAPPLVLLHGLFGQARNFGQIQRALAQRWRVLALDLRNHGASPHAPDMRYATMAEDVLETLAARDALPAALIGHSMGGKVAMRAALLRPEAVERLLVADIAPVVYPPHNQPIVDAMLRVPLHDGLTRAAADAALLASVPEASVRAFLLQNLRLGTPPAWRIGLDEIEAAMADIEGWDRPADATSAGATYEGATYAGRTLFVAGETSGYISREDRPAIRVLFPAARFVTVKRAGHWLHADNPAGFLAVVEAFLSTPQVQ
jgi:pimeloyl-ACP methyl ester carboxylesterase